MYSVWCEWEIGQEDRVWKSEESAERWIEAQFENGLEAELGMTYEECKDEGLFGSTALEVMDD